jgi:hypothetical protein
MNELAKDLNNLVEAATKAIIIAGQTQQTEDAQAIKNQLRRLPDQMTTEVLNGIILNLVNTQPELCRWFILDIFLEDAPPEGRADVAERLNLLIADLQSQ